jgi:hypothetical protein
VKLTRESGRNNPKKEDPLSHPNQDVHIFRTIKDPEMIGQDNRANDRVKQSADPPYRGNSATSTPPHLKERKMRLQEKGWIVNSDVRLSVINLY